MCFSGTTNSYLSPFRRWNINTSEPRCSNISHSCIVYKTLDLQSYDKESSSAFHFNLRAHNYGGYYCDIDTDFFYLPSLLLPSYGVVYDVADSVTDDTAGVLHDIDYSLSLRKLCMTWRGFGHHEDLVYKVGVGSRQILHDVIDFMPPSHSSWHCFLNSSFVPYAEYFLTLSVKNSAGLITMSTDGIIIIDKNDFVSSLTVLDGTDCDDVKVAEEINIYKDIPVLGNTSIKFVNRLHAGQSYTLMINASSDQFTIQGADIVLDSHQYGASRKQFIPMVNSPVIEIVNTGNGSLNVAVVKIIKCFADADVIPPSNVMHVHWTLDPVIVKYVSHFEIELVERCSSVGCEKIVIPYHNIGSNFGANISTQYSLGGGAYFFKVRPCFGEICSAGKESNGFTVEANKPTAGIVRGEITRIGSICTDVELHFETFSCASTNPALFYRWVISGNDGARKILSNYTVIDASSVSTRKIMVSF